ncbi:hypothetical protein GCM10027449_26260 [Sinomonas notoginsengisoli]|uniref:hypothetical protein n=1 Tax=Sinomonas notoginsengisoli TaxID=1457311 RepID=UPI001F1B5A37|nr:hypothetical protein [Sinomonas notoginsengisoli]
MSYRLRTPEQVAEELGRDEAGELHLPPLAIRRLVREGKVRALRGPRSKVLFDDAAIQQMLEALREPGGGSGVDLDAEPDWEEMGNPFNFATIAGRGRGHRK